MDNKKSTTMKPKIRQFTVHDSKNDYDDDNIPEIDLPKTTDVVPDEISRRDGPGGE